MRQRLKLLRFSLPFVSYILTVLSASPAIAADGKLAAGNIQLPGAPGSIQAHGFSSFFSSAPFFIKGLANKCIDASPPEIRHLGRLVYLWDCNNTTIGARARDMAPKLEKAVPL